MLWFCLREADAPQVVISTTPKPLPHVKKLVSAAGRRRRRTGRAGAAAGGAHAATCGRTTPLGNKRQFAHIKHPLTAALRTA